MGNQKAMDAKSENLKTFNGNPVDFKDWSERFEDHMAKIHMHWRAALRWVGSTEEDLGYQRLRRESVGPYNESVVELSNKLEQTLVNYTP